MVSITEKDIGRAGLRQRPESSNSRGADATPLAHKTRGADATPLAHKTRGADATPLAYLPVIDCSTLLCFSAFRRSGATVSRSLGSKPALLR